jgi:hypothetical protein
MNRCKGNSHLFSTPDTLKNAMIVALQVHTKQLVIDVYHQVSTKGKTMCVLACSEQSRRRFSISNAI